MKLIKNINCYLDKPHLYPYIKPFLSYVIRNCFIYLFEQDNNLTEISNRIVIIKGRKVRLKDILKKAAPLKDRIPVISYGSNSNPYRLYKLFLEGGCSTTVIIFKGYIEGFDMIFNSILSGRGVVSSQLTLSPLTKLEVWTSLLDHQQLFNLNKAMGINQDGTGGYNLCSIRFQYEDGNHSINCYVYIPRDNPAFIDTESKEPIRFPTSDYKGENRQLVAYEHFIPINVTNRKIREGEKIKCEIEMMQLFHSLVLSEFGYELYDKRNHLTLIQWNISRYNP
jgi:hypothetical protein